MVQQELLGGITVAPEPRKKVTPAAADAAFLSEAQLKDAAVEFALRHIELEEGLEHINVAYRVREDGVWEQYEPEMRLTESEVREKRSRVEEEKAALEEVEHKGEELRGRKHALTDKIQTLRFNIYVTVQEIRKRRLEKEKELFEAEGQKLKAVADQGYDDAICDLEKQIEVAQRLYALDRKRWEINRPEYERRVRELTKERERVDAELNAVRHNVGSLKRFGITRHTAGFLIWAGYASLAGVGGVVANLLNDRAQGGTGSSDYISLTFQYLTNIVKGLQSIRSGWDFWYNVVWPSVVVTVILAVTGVLIYLVDKVLKRFGEDWPREKSESGGRSRAERKEKGGKGSREQPPLFTPDINRLSLKLPEVDRKSYARLLALLPYIFLAFVIVVLSVGGAPPTGNNTGGQQPQTADVGALSMTYIGIVFTLLTVSVSILYATKVIEPRLHKLAEARGRERGADGGAAVGGGRPERPPFGLYLRAHWEFVVVIASMALALVLAAALSVQSQRTTAIWAAVALFMCLSSMALAYGIIQRGLFRSEDFLEGKRDLYRRLIEKYSKEPTIVDVFEVVEPGKIKSLVDGYRESRQDLDELRLLYELKRRFADNYMDDKDILGYWGSLKSWAKPLGFMREFPFRKFEPTEPDLIDRESAPEETAALDRYREERLHTANQLGEVAAETAETEKSRAKTEAGLRALEREIAEGELKVVELRQSYEQEKARLRVRREADCLTFKAAYSVGAKLSDFIDWRE
jgi:hypothetical protein